MALHAEYGVSDRVTVLGRMAWQNVRRRYGLDVESAQGLAASEFGLRWQAWQTSTHVTSFQITGLVPGQGENVSNRPLGDGGQAWEARALWGWSGNGDVFVDAQAAYRWRDHANLDEVRLDLTAGWRPADAWLVLGQAFSVHSAEAAKPGAPEFDQLKLQASVGRRFGEVEYHLGAFVTPYGRNTIEERAVFVSVWRRF